MTISFLYPLNLRINIEERGPRETKNYHSLSILQSPMATQVTVNQIAILSWRLLKGKGKTVTAERRKIAFEYQ